jgi:hypothetical protein
MDRTLGLEIICLEIFQHPTKTMSFVLNYVNLGKYKKAQSTLIKLSNVDGRWLIISKDAQIFGCLDLFCFYILFIAKFG